MPTMAFFLASLNGSEIVLGNLEASEISPQPEPTSERIKGLLSRALVAPEGLSPAEVQEMAASVVYHLIVTKSRD